MVNFNIFNEIGNYIAMHLGKPIDSGYAFYGKWIEDNWDYDDKLNKVYDYTFNLDNIEVKQIYPNQKSLDSLEKLVAIISGKKNIFSEFFLVVRGYLKFKKKRYIPSLLYSSHKKGVVDLWTSESRGFYEDILKITGKDSTNIKAVLNVRSEVNDYRVRNKNTIAKINVLNEKNLEKYKKQLLQGKHTYYKGGEGMERLFRIFEVSFMAVKPELDALFIKSINQESSIQEEQELETKTLQMDETPSTSIAQDIPITHQVNASIETEIPNKYGETYIKCYNCGKENKSSTNFCTGCGMVVIKKICTVCGRGNKSNSKFCIQCGSRL